MNKRIFFKNKIKKTVNKIERNFRSERKVFHKTETITLSFFSIQRNFFAAGKWK